MHIHFRKIILLGLALANLNLFSDTAFVTHSSTTFYAFDTADVANPATTYSTSFNSGNITYSPNGTTVYLVGNGNEVYSFLETDPTTITPLFTGIVSPNDIAISSDGLYGFVPQSNGTGIGLYSFPTNLSGSHTATLLNPTGGGAIIANPTNIVISGDHAFVGDSLNGLIYSVIFTPTTYNATQIQDVSSGNLSGLAISSDGYLYISGGNANQISRVPLTTPTLPPQIVAFTGGSPAGIAVSNDGKTVYFANYVNGVNSFFTNPPFPASVTNLSGLNINSATAIAINPIFTPIPNATKQPSQGFFKIISGTRPGNKML